MLQLLRIPALAVLTFVVGTLSLGASLQGDLPSFGTNSSVGEQDVYKCGNGIMESNEECDDGNGNEGDECSNRCKRPRCGDTIVQFWKGEQCDLGMNNGQTGTCTQDCKFTSGGSASQNATSASYGSSGSAGSEGYCGNGIQESNEECDDGNNDDNDSCSLYCKKRAPAKCGDGKVESGEQCDDGNTEDMDGCSNMCILARCGDKVTQKMEQCDDGNNKNEDDCMNNCRKPRCGDGMTQSWRGEECDQGDINGFPGQCTSDCRRPAGQALCGNGTREDGEECDDGNTNNADDCTIMCKKAFCGDGIRQHNEECDLGKSNGFGACTQECRKVTSSSGTSNDITEVPLPPSSVSPIDTQSTSATWSPSNDSEAMKRQMEEALRKAQEEERRLQEAVKREQERLDRERLNSFLGCFDVQGNWVRQRDLCDPNQKRHTQEGAKMIEVEQGRTETIPVRPVQTVPEEQVREEIRKQLLGDDIAERQRKDLLVVLNNAKERITMLSRGNFAPEVADYLTSAINWIDQGIQYFSGGPRTAEEIQLMNEPVRTLMSQIADLVASQKQLPKEKPQINPIVERTELLLGKFRAAFVVLSQSGIGLDQAALQAYVDAAQRFLEVKESCTQQGRDCSALNDVLEKLKEARPWLDDQLNAHPDIAKKAGL